MVPHKCNNPKFNTDFHRCVRIWPPKIDLNKLIIRLKKTLKIREIGRSGKPPVPATGSNFEVGSWKNSKNYIGWLEMIPRSQSFR